MKTTRKPGDRRIRSIRLFGGLALLALMLGCAGVAPPRALPEPPSFRMVVLDFRVPDAWYDPMAPDRVDKEIRGWWFGSRGVFHNPGLGRVAGDIFADHLNRLAFVTLVSRVDLKYYMAEKRDRIKTVLDERRREYEQSADPAKRKEAERIDNMTEADYERLLSRLPAREIGRELNADRVLVGRVHEAYLSHNRTIHWFWSYVDLEVDIVDVDTGNVVWHGRDQYKRNFASTAQLLEYAASDMIDKMNVEYFSQI